MTFMVRFCLFAFLLGATSIASAQVTNLVINDTSNTFFAVQGEMIEWEYDIPPGETAQGEIWIDVNRSGLPDGNDKLVYKFIQVDGQNVEGENQIPDHDESDNGHVVFSTRQGLAPANYIFVFSNYGIGPSPTGQVVPTFFSDLSIQGTVTPPTGKSAANILISAHTSGNFDPDSWMALTDSSGHYTIQFNPGAENLSWRVTVDDEISPSVVSPQSREVLLSSSASGIDFVFLASAAKVRGYLRDDDEQPLAFESVYIDRVDTGESQAHYQGRTNQDGFFELGILASDLNGSFWRIAQPYRWSQTTTTHMLALGSLPVISAGDSLARNLTAYTTNSTIRGRVSVNGLPPWELFLLFATNNDSGEAYAWVDTATGEFSIPVSDKISRYELRPEYSMFPWYNETVEAHAGDTGIVINIVIESVREREAGTPSAFTLSQNYPNPFNPETRIDYDVPRAGDVQLKVYNLLGQQVAVIVDGYQQAGKYTARFDAGKLSAGVYFYKLSVGNTSATRRMVLVK